MKYIWASGLCCHCHCLHWLLSWKLMDISPSMAPCELLKVLYPGARVLPLCQHLARGVTVGSSPVWPLFFAPRFDPYQGCQKSCQLFTNAMVASKSIVSLWTVLKCTTGQVVISVLSDHDGNINHSEIDILLMINVPATSALLKYETNR